MWHILGEKSPLIFRRKLLHVLIWQTICQNPLAECSSEAEPFCTLYPPPLGTLRSKTSDFYSDFCPKSAIPNRQLFLTFMSSFSSGAWAFWARLSFEHLPVFWMHKYFSEIISCNFVIWIFALSLNRGLWRRTRGEEEPIFQNQKPARYFT